MRRIIPDAGSRRADVVEPEEKTRCFQSCRCRLNSVATVAIDGGMNAAILAAKILATSDEEL